MFTIELAQYTFIYLQGNQKFVLFSSSSSDFVLISQTTGQVGDLIASELRISAQETKLRADQI